MQTRTLGKTSVTTSTLAYGCWRLAGSEGSESRSADQWRHGIAAVTAAAEDSKAKVGEKMVLTAIRQTYLRIGKTPPNGLRARYQVSIQAVRQESEPGRPLGQGARLAILTHAARVGDMKAAVEDLAAMPEVTGGITLMRVEG